METLQESLLFLHSVNLFLGLTNPQHTRLEFCMKLLHNFFLHDCWTLWKVVNSARTRLNTTKLRDSYYSMIIFHRLCLIHVLGMQRYLLVCSMDMHPASYLHGHLWSESGAWEKGDVAHFHRTTGLRNWGLRLWSKVCSASAQQVNTNCGQSVHEDRLQQDWRPKQNVSCFIILSFQTD